MDAALPTPVRATVAGLPVALCAMDSEADFAPAEVGANVTVTFALSPDATVAVAGEAVNCDESAPVTLIPVTDRLAVPVFRIVTVFWEVAPTVVLSNVSDVADRLIGGSDDL